MVAKTFANIVPFIKAFEPNMIWPNDIHIHDTQKSHGCCYLFQCSNECFIPEISMIAKWDKESTLLRRIKHATIHHTLF